MQQSLMAQTKSLLREALSVPRFADSRCCLQFSGLLERLIEIEKLSFYKVLGGLGFKRVSFWEAKASCRRALGLKKLSFYKVVSVLS